MGVDFLKLQHVFVRVKAININILSRRCAIKSESTILDLKVLFENLWEIQHLKRSEDKKKKRIEKSNA